MSSSLCSVRQCSVCCSIDFRKYLREKRLLAIQLGSWEDICKEKRCRFCRLVRDAIFLHAHKPSPEAIIKLSNKRSWKCCTSYNEYHGIRWKAYSNEFDLQAYAKKTQTDSRYQFFVYWDLESTEMVEVLLRPLCDGPFFGRAVDRDHADLALCRKWLEACDNYHAGSFGQCIGKKSSRRFLRENLRLIDVDKNKIVKGASDRTRYVALSYVWGQDKMKREMPKSLKAAVRTGEDGIETIELPELLPRTIRDALEVTRSIGYRFLWVDSLCIVQDDDEDRDLQIDMMDEIYSNATLTIAAGTGLHADWGLPGVSRPRHYTQRSEIVNGVELAVEFPSFRSLNSGTSLIWNSRGWTLQEKVLSKRLLLFTDFQVYFRCANSVCSEDVAMETGALSTNMKRRPNPFQWGANRDAPSSLERIGDLLTFNKLKLTDKNWNLTFLPNYVALVAEFSLRTFSFKKDTLKAMSGVLYNLDQSKLAFPGGLPRAWFAEALLWQPEYASTYSINPESSRLGIPSWSWAAWALDRGCVWPEFARPKALACGGPQMTIYVEDKGESILLYSTDVKSGKFSESRISATSMALSISARQQLKLSGTLLRFETPIQRFKIGVATKNRDMSEKALQTFYLLDHASSCVGKIWTCARVARKPGDHEFIFLSIRKTGEALEGAVAKEYFPKGPSQTVLDKDPTTGAYTGTSSTVEGPVYRKPFDWKVENVMLVEWKGSIAFRVAVGQVISTAREEGRRQMVYLG